MPKLITILCRPVAARKIMLSFFMLNVLCSFCQQVCPGRKSLLIEDVFKDERPYRLVFSDEFGGNLLDTAIWNISVGVMRHVEKTKYWLRPENVTIENGTLFLQAQRDTFINQCFELWIDTAMQKFCKDFYFSAGEIRTKASFSHGIFEIRCKLPRGKGLGTAFWAFGNDHNEIDVFEFYNEYNIFGKIEEKKLSAVQRTNIRTDYENDKRIEDCSAISATKDFYSDFHVFSAEWTPQKIVWRVDGEVVRVTTLFSAIDGKILDQPIPANTPVIVNRAFPRNPMEIYVSLGLDLDSNDKDSTPLPAFFEIDYVRYYSR